MSGVALPVAAPGAPVTRALVCVPARRRVARLARRASFALAGTVLAFAATHLTILAAHAVRHRDAGALNLFSVLEAQRLWPALADERWMPVSAALGIAIFALMFAGPARGLAIVRVRRRARGPVAVPPAGGPAPAPGRNGHVPRPRVSPSPRPDPPARGAMVRGWLALAAGIGFHMLALGAIEQLVPAFPPVPDVVHERLPYVDFGVPGELAFAVFLAGIVAVLFRRQRATVPRVLVLLGIFYAVRGVFLFLLPIGAPPTAPPVTERFVFWPFPGHAYFPGGHTGMMTVLSLSVVSRRARRLFLAGTALFAVGTLLARTHYAADALGGAMLGSGIVLAGRVRLAGRASRFGACRMPRDSAAAARGVREVS